MSDQQQRQSLIGAILKSSRARVERVLSRRAGVEPVRRNLELGDLEERVLYSATPVPVPAEAEMEACVACEAPAEGQDAATDTVQHTTTQLVVIDESVADYQELIDGLVDNPEDNFEVLILDSQRDGLEQITEMLAAREDISALHIVSHGQDGSVQLGNTTLNADNLSMYAGMLGQWDQSLTGDADILFYGCDLGASAEGRDFVDSLSILTGADVAASDDLTGHEDLGGDWELEIQVGQVESPLAFSQLVQANWFSTLVAPEVEFTNGETIHANTSLQVGSSDLDFTFDTDVGNADIRVTLDVDHGSLTLTDQTGLTLVGGDWFASPSVTLEGSESDFSSAVQGLVYTPDEDWTGTATVTVSVDDLQGGSAADSFAIGVLQPLTSAGTDTVAGTNATESNAGHRRGVTRAVSTGLDGTSVVAWRNGANDQAQWQIVGPDGQLGGVQTFPGADGRFASVAIDKSDPNGSFIATWTVGTADDSDIRIQRFAFNGATTGPIVNVTSIGIPELNSSIASNAAGDYVVIWETPTGPQFQRFNNNDQPIDAGPVSVPGSVGGNNPAIGIDADQNLLISWDDGDGIYYTRYSGGSFATTQTLSTAADAGGSAIAVNEAGQGVITWHDQAASWNIHAQQINGDGTHNGPSYPVASTPGVVERNPSVSISEAGDFAIAWETDARIEVINYTWAGTSIGEVRVDTPYSPERFNNHASVSLLDANNFVVVYSEDAGGQSDVLARRFTTPVTDTADPTVFAQNPVTAIPGQTITAEILLVDPDTDASELVANYVPSGDITSVTEGPSSGALRTVDLTIDPAAVIGTTSTLTIEVTDNDGDTIPLTIGVNIVAQPPLEVTTTDDFGDGGDTSSISALLANPGSSGISLREAIEATNNTANVGGPDVIRFNIAGAGPQVIDIGFGLPNIADAVIIDGASQGDWVVLDGNDGGYSGLTLGGGSDGSSISGLIVRDFGFAGITLESGSNHTVHGNLIGSFSDTGAHTVGEGNQGGIQIQSDGNTIGGSDIADRNVLSGNTIYGVQFDGTASGNQLVGNYIGTDRTGTIDVGNMVDGVRLLADASTNTIDSNLISGNDSTGITFFQNANNNFVTSNLIGVAADGASGLGNGTQGIWFLDSSSSNVIGGSLADANTIAFSGDAGISVGPSATGNSLRFNAIHDNDALGIDLGSDGVHSANDNLDGDTGANQGQNFPVLQAAVVSGADVEVIGSVNSTPNTTLVIDFYASATADPLGHGEAERHIGSVTQTTDPSGEVNFSVTLTDASVALGEAVTATATDPMGNTSEFSLNVIASSGTENIAPVNIGPGFVRTQVDRPLVLASEFANHLRIRDTDAGVGVLRLTLEVTHGSLTLAQTDGLGFVSGDGFQDREIVVFGTLSELNAALDGLVYSPESGFTGVVDLTMETSDQGNSGFGGEKIDTDVMQISVGYELPTVDAFVVNQTTDGNQETSAEESSSKNAVALLPDGSYVVVWTDPGNDADGSQGVYARILNADGSEKVPEFQVSSAPDGDEKWASVAADDQGRFAVVWTQSDGDGDGVYLRRFNADGSPRDTMDVLVNSHTVGLQEDAHVAVNGNGEGVIVWEGVGPADNHGIWSSTFTFDSAPADQVRVNATIAGVQANAGVAINDNGDWVVTYLGPSGDVRVRQFDSAGVPGTDTQVAAGVLSFPTVGINDDGSFLVAYNREAFGPDRIDYVTYSATGVRGQSGSVADVSGLGKVAIAADGTGHFVLVYEAEWFMNATIGQIGLFADGTVAQATTPAATLVDGGGFLPSVDIRDRYNSVFVWTQSGGDGDGSAIVARTTGTLQAEGLIFSTAGTGSALGETFGDDGILTFGGSPVDLGATTSGTLDVVNLSDFLPGAPGLNGLSVIQRDIVVGPDSQSSQLRKGDLLVLLDQDHSIFLGPTYTAEDLLLVRPIAGTDRAAISVIATSGQPVQAVTLVEQDTLVGDTVVKAGDLLFVVGGAGVGQDIWVSGITSGAPSELLIRGSDIGVDAQITAIDVAEQTMVIGNQTIAAGSIILSTDATVTVGDNGISIRDEDLVVLEVSTTTLGSGTTSATASRLFDGSDVGFGDGMGESIDAVTAFAGSITNSAPELTPTSPSLDTTDEETPSSAVRVHSIVAGATTDINGDWVGIAITGLSGNGQWQYTVDGGALWVPITSVSPTSALLLGPTAELRYVPDGLRGETATVTYQAWDQTAGVQGGTANATVNGGSTAISVGADTLSLTVTDVNDAPVIPTGQILDVDEDAANDAVVGTVVATDVDPVATYTFTLADSDNGRFKIDAATGEIQVRDTTQLDFENATSHIVTVVVNDGTVDSTAIDVTITINDVNDVAPVISASQEFTVVETAAVGRFVGTVTSTDPDGAAPQNWTIVSGNVDSIFSIDPDTGDIRIADNTSLDHVTTDTYTLEIQVEDGVNTSSTESVLVRVEQGNDLAPVVDVGQSFSAVEGDANGTSLGFVTGVDPDNGASGTGGQGGSSFAVQLSEANGVSAIQQGLPAVAGEEYRLEGYFLTESTLPASGSFGLLKIVFRDASGNDLETTNIASGQAGPSASPGAESLPKIDGSSPVNSWIFSEVQATAPAGTTEVLFLAINVDFGGGENPLWFDSLDASLVGDGTDILQNGDFETGNLAGWLDFNPLGSTEVGSPGVGSLGNWTIVGANPGFAIDPDTGELTIADTSGLDFETASTYELQVTVSDGVFTSMSETVTVTLSDTNDERPVVGASQAFTISESSVPNAAVGTVLATDADSVGSLQNWTIESGNDLGIFAIDPSTGAISVADPTSLDFEAEQQHTLVVSVSDGVQTSLPVDVTINISDENDEAPVVGAMQTFSVNELATDGTSFGFVSGSDPDTVGALQGWTIVSGGDGVIGIDPATGELFIADSTGLDFELKEEYTLTVTVGDGVQTSVSETVVVSVVDANDNDPVIASGLSFTVPEDIANGIGVGTVTATDADTNTTYVWSLAGDAGGRFSINPTSGQLLVANTALLDFEDTTTHTVTVVVSDGLNNSTQETVTINLTDVNDTAPVISAGQSFTVAEDIADSSVVGQVVATDLDTNTVLEWSLSNDAGGRFSIDPTTGEILVLDTGRLDFETTETHLVTVVANDGVQDSAVQAVTINLTDVNDTAPVIGAGQNFPVSEDAANGTIVGAVQATDVDTNTVLEWSLTNDLGGRFSIDPTTGEILVLDTTLLDFEDAQTFAVTVVASDGVQNSAPQSVTINLTDVNDNAPVISAGQSFTVAEDIADSSVVGQVVATDADTNTVLEWSLSNDAGGRFSIDPTTGEILVLDTTLLDLEDAQTYAVTVVASDGIQDSSLQSVTINLTDVNDNAPVIGAGQNFPVAEDAANGTIVGGVQATDVDTNTVLEWSLSNDAGGRFSIDPTTGEILVLDTTLLDFETTATHTVTVVANDGVQDSASQAVTINLTDANDNAPVIGAGQVLSISEDAMVGDAVGIVNSTDVDTVGSAQNWAIVGGDTDSIFGVDSVSGEVFVADPTNLDFDTTASYTLTLQVEDGANTSATQTVTINVTDVNDLAPVVNPGQIFVATEGDPVGTGLGIVTGFDPDSGTLQNWQITEADSPFAIDPVTGEITIRDSSLLDFETQQAYTATVVVTDGQFNSPDQTVAITLLDANDEAPVVTPSQSFSVSEAVGTGTSIGFVTATDPDTVGTLQGWTILSGDDGVIGIDPVSGELFIADDTNLDYEAREQYTLTVRVGDGVQNSATETVVVSVTDVDDTAPVIDSGQNFVISEASPGGQFVGQATASDVDTATPLSNWSIVGGSSTFVIDSTTGVITVSDPAGLDFESAVTHTLPLTVSDGTQTSVPVDVTVSLTDVNDVGPLIIVPLPGLSVDENSPVGTVVGTLTAVDQDTVGSIENWRIVGGDPNGVFEIDSDTGEIRVADSTLLDYETQSSYTLDIQVGDGNQDSAPASVQIDVIDLQLERTLSGVIYEDIAGDGTAGTNNPVENVRVDLYRDTGDGIANNADVLVRSVFTTGTGYQFTDLADATYYVVVDSRTVTSTTDPNVTADIWAEQTYGSAGSLQRGGHTSSDGLLYGGRFALRSDDASSLATAEHVTRVNLQGSEDGIHFGFSFNVVTNTLGGDTQDDDTSSGRTVQGSLRQFIENANAIDGPNRMRFVPVEAANEGDGTNEWWKLTVTHALPTITGAGTVIDGTAWSPIDASQTLNPNDQILGRQQAVGLGADGIRGTADDVLLTGVEAPELEIANDRSVNIVGVGIDIAADDVEVRSLSIYGFGTGADTNSGNIRVGIDATSSHSGVRIENNVIGSAAGNFQRPEHRNDVSNIAILGADQGTIQNNLIGFSDQWGVKFDFDADGWTVQNNEFLRSSTQSSSHDAIDLLRGSGDAIIVGNFFKQTGGTAIDSFRSDGGNFISDNTILESGQLGAETAGVRLFGTGNTVQQNVIDRNFAPDGSGGAGIIVVGSHSTIAASQKNVISRNYFGDNQGPSIDLVSGGQSSGSNARGDGLTLTPGYDSDTGNEGIDAPLLSAATSVGTSVTLTGKSEPNSTVEIYTAVADGIGQQYIGQTTTNGSGEFTFEFAAKSSITAVTANVTDAAGNTSEFGAMLVVNAAPQITSPSVIEVVENLSLVVQLTATDIETASSDLTWTVTGGADAGAFTVTSGGQLEFVTPQDFETGQNQFEVEVTVRDEAGATDVRTLQVTVAPANDNAPTFTTPGAVRVSESQTAVIDVDATDGDAPVQTLTYSIQGTDASHFAIDPATGNLTFNSPPDFESPADTDGDNVYEIQVSADDGNGATTVQTLLVTVTDENDSTPDLTSAPIMQLPEDSSNGTVAAVFGVADADTVGGPHQYTLLDNFDGLFTLDADTGELTVQNASLLDFETASSYELPITVSDGVNQSTSTIRIDISNVNEAPFDIVLDNTVVAENDAGALIGELFVSDPDSADTHTFTVDDTRFEVVNGRLKLKPGVSLDAEALLPTKVTVTATDAAGLSVSQRFPITIQDVNEAPSGIALSNDTVLENVAGAVIGQLSVTDIDVGDGHEFVVNHDSFEVVDGTLRLKPGEHLDFEANEVVQIKVTATDSAGASVSEEFEINVLDHSLRSQDELVTVSEDAASFEWNLNDLFADPQLDSELSFTVRESNGGLANFTLEDGILTVTPKENTHGEEVFTVEATTVQGEAAQANLTLAVTSVNDAPEATGPGELTLTDSLASPISLLDAELSSDIDGDELTVQPVQQPQNGTLTVNPDGTFVYNPDGSANVDSFSYVLTDGQDVSEEIQVDLRLANVVAPSLPAIVPVVSEPEPEEVGPGVPIAPPPASLVPVVSVVSESVPETQTALDDTTSTPDADADAEAEVLVANKSPNPGLGRDTNDDGTADEVETGNIFDQSFLNELQPDDEDALVVPGFLPFQREVAEESRTLSQRTAQELSLEADEATAQRIARETAGEIIARQISGPAKRVIRQQVARQLDQDLDNLNEDLAAPRVDQVVFGTAGLSMGGLSVGYIIWLLRGGSLVASMLTSIPAWRMVDPLPILDFLDGNEEDQESLDQLIERNKKLISSGSTAGEGQ